MGGESCIVLRLRLMQKLAMSLNVLKNPPEAAKVATLENSSMLKKPRHVFLIKILIYNFGQLCLTLMSTAVFPSALWTSSYQRKKKYLVHKSV